jgi:hypothetical protein
MFIIRATKISNLIIIVKKVEPWQYFIYNILNEVCVSAKDIGECALVCELESLEEVNLLLGADLDL